MDTQSWSTRVSSAAKRYQSALQSQSGIDMFLGFEEADADEDMREELPCPFCSDYFDIVGLCCHIDDDHPVEAKNGVCPICASRVGFDMVSHITLHHGNIFRMQRKRKLRKGSAHSSLSLLKRELQEGSLQSLLGGSCMRSSSNNTAPDPLLSSFILPVTDNAVSSHPNSSPSSFSDKKPNSDDVTPERVVSVPPLSTEDKEEKERRSHFVHGLLLSTIVEEL